MLACNCCLMNATSGVYQKDSFDDHGLVKAAGPEFARRMTQEIIPQSCETLSHLLGQSLIEIDGDTARAETYYLAVTLSDAAGVPMCNQLGGRYVDRLMRQGSIWKIAHRICLLDWSVSHEVKIDTFTKSQLTQGKRGISDAGAALLGLIAATENPTCQSA